MCDPVSTTNTHHSLRNKKPSKGHFDGDYQDLAYEQLLRHTIIGLNAVCPPTRMIVTNYYVPALSKRTLAYRLNQT